MKVSIIFCWSAARQIIPFCGDEGFDTICWSAAQQTLPFCDDEYLHIILVGNSTKKTFHFAAMNNLEIGRKSHKLEIANKLASRSAGSQGQCHNTRTSTRTRMRRLV